jgi:predicted DNA-binding transcriptional regulator YafY
MEPMANTSARTLRLLSLLQNHRYWPGAELADRLEVSVRTLRRDIDRLRELGYPVEAQRGVDGGYQLAAGASLPPLLLEDDEAVALAVGLQAAVQSGSIAGIAESSVRALAKVVQVMPRRLRRQVEALRTMTVPWAWEGPSAAVDSELLAELAQVCRDDERVDLRYTAADGTSTERLVEPHRLVVLGRRWYLVAYDLTNHGWRTFRVDRTEGIVNTGVRFAQKALPDGATDAAAFVRDSLQSAPWGHSIVVVVQAPAADVERAVGRWAVVQPRADGRSVVRMTTDNLDWPALALGSLGADFDVVEPPELVDHLHAWARRFRKAALVTSPSVP